MSVPPVFEHISEELIGLAFTLISTAIVWMFRPRVKLIYGRANNSLNTIFSPDPAFPEDATKRLPNQIYVEKFFIQNFGRQPATQVDLVLSSWPSDVTIFEPREVQFKAIAKGECLIQIPRIAPRELVIVDCIYLNSVSAEVLSVKSAEAVGQLVDFHTVRKFGLAGNILILMLFVFGIAFALQILLKVVGIL